MNDFEGTYNALANCYDDMTEDVNYPAWADFLEECFAQVDQPVKTVLDLACGTGTMSFLLAQRGYEMIGVDFSPDMLAMAAEKTLPEGVEPPIFLCQPMEELDLYGTVDACVCLLDSVNHVTDPACLRRAFQRVRLFLEPGGLFVFDVHTPSHLESLDGGMFLDETEEAYCVWRTEYDWDRRVCTYAMDVFQLVEEDLWERDGEVHEEYAYTVEELKDFLQEAGFIDIRIHGELTFQAPGPEAARIFFTARKPKEQQR